MRGLSVLAAAVALAGCASPIGRDGRPIGLARAVCESFPGTRCCPAPGLPPLPQPYCTSSLGRPDCYANPSRLPADLPPLADTPPPAPGCG